MHYFRRILLIAVISSGMILPQGQPSLQAATDRPKNPGPDGAPFGVVVRAVLAHLGGANLVGGTTAYPGDFLDTAVGGNLRLVVGGGQVYLLSDSAAKLMRAGSVLQASMTRGTVGFSALTGQQFQIVTPEGVVEAADGLPAFGQVTFSGPSDIVVSAYTGALVLHRGRQTLLVKAGESYYVSLVADDAPPQRRAGVTPAYSYHLVWRIIVVGAAAGVGYYLWQLYSVSPVLP